MFIRIFAQLYANTWQGGSIRIFGPKKAKFGPQYAFSGTYWPCRFIWCPVGWWFWHGLFLARHLFTFLFDCYTCHTILYFWLQYNPNESSVTEKGNCCSPLGHSRLCATPGTAVKNNFSFSIWERMKMMIWNEMSWNKSLLQSRGIGK